MCDLQQIMMCLGFLPLKKSSQLYKEATRFLLTCVLICSAVIVMSTKNMLMKAQAWLPVSLLIHGFCTFKSIYKGSDPWGAEQSELPLT